MAPPQSIDFLDEVTFADAADRGIARHLPQRLDAMGQQESAATHTGGKPARPQCSVAATDPR